MSRWLWSLAGCGLIVAGAAAGLYGLFLVILPGDSPNSGRLLPFWIGGSVILGSLAIVLAGLWLVMRNGFIQKPGELT